MVVGERHAVTAPPLADLSATLIAALEPPEDTP